MPKIRRALLSVYDKKGLVPFARALSRRGVKLLSTGRTALLLRKNRIPVQDVSDYTGYPELLNGRVKTLHPKIHAAILADRGNRSHMKTLKARGIEPIDLVAVDLYPFEEGLRKGTRRVSEALERIDIGGVALLRAAAKNFQYVTAVPGSDFYAVVSEALKKSGIPETLNRTLAYQAFLRTSRYDQAIRDFFGAREEEVLPERLTLSYRKGKTLRYGENPHQKAALYADSEVSLPGDLSLQGKPLSFNNLLDVDSAFQIVRAFKKPCATIIKHATPCGVGLGATLREAFQRAWGCDPESAFGGVVGLNRKLNLALARTILESGFLEVITFPDIDPGALRLLRRKKNLRLVPFGAMVGQEKPRPLEFRMLSSGGVLIQTPDAIPFRLSQCRCVTRRKPTQAELRSLSFAFQVAKHVHSNAIVIAKEEATVGIGGGQPSRVGAVRLAVEKGGARTEGAALASDGFFPFPDSVELAAGAGIHAIIQPGGSIRDREVIEACNRWDMAMVFTGTRHFKH